MKSRSAGVTARTVSALFLLVAGVASSQVTEDAASELVAAFDSAADNLWRDTGPAGRSYVHRQGVDANGIGFNQVAVPVGGVTIAGQPRNVTAAFLSGAGESTGSYDLPSTGSASFELWFEIADVAPEQMLFEAGGSGNGIAIAIAEGTLTFFHGGGGVATDEITTPISAGWHQVVGVVHNTNDATANDTLDLYLDGTLAASSAAPVDIGDWAGGNQGGVGRAASSFGDASSVLQTGATAGEGLPLVGKVAIFRLYNRALSAVEVTETLQTGEGPVPPAEEPGLLAPPPLVAETRPGIVAGPVFEYDATILRDLRPWEPTGINATEDFTGDPLFSQAPEPVSDPAVPGINAAHDTSALTVAGATGISDAYNYWSRFSGTFELWVDANVGPATGTQIIFECGGSGSGTMLSLSNDQLSFFANGVDTAEVVAPLTSGWHQIVGVVTNSFDATANDFLELYVDGVSVGTSATVNLDDWAGGNQAGLGNRGGGSYASGSTPFGDTIDADAPFQGRIAAFRFYGGAREATEIQQNFAQLQVPNEVVEPLDPGVVAEGMTVSGSDAQVAFSYASGVGVNVYRSTDLASFPRVAGGVTVSPFVDTGILGIEDRAFYRLELEQTLASFDFPTAAFATDETVSGTTLWERGTPTVGPLEFPGGESVVWGTDLDANYAFSTHAILRTDAFDLAGLDRAVLRLTQWHDLEVVGVDPEPITGIIRVVDAAGTTELAELARVTGSSIGWGVGVYELPADVLGQSVRFEFELVSDAAAVTNFAGWYLQRVEVEVLPTAP